MFSAPPEPQKSHLLRFVWLLMCLLLEDGIISFSVCASNRQIASGNEFIRTPSHTVGRMPCCSRGNSKEMAWRGQRQGRRMDPLEQGHALNASMPGLPDPRCTVHRREGFVVCSSEQREANQSRAGGERLGNRSRVLGQRRSRRGLAKTKECWRPGRFRAVEGGTCSSEKRGHPEPSRRP